ncbi:MAG: hypothetical protein AB2A00_33615 [Myxococcota bacterium]
MTAWPEVGRAELEELRHKYEVLLRLHDEREAAAAAGLTGFSGAERDARRLAMKRLAARFPGALRELDALDRAALLDRRQALQAVLDAAPPELPGLLAQPAHTWMSWMWLFHALTREMLHVKRRLALQARGLVERGADGRWPEPAVLGPQGYPEVLQRRILDPPRGHLTHLVYELLSTRLGCPAPTLQEAIFGPPKVPAGDAAENQPGHTNPDRA